MKLYGATTLSLRQKKRWNWGIELQRNWNSISASCLVANYHLVPLRLLAQIKYMSASAPSVAKEEPFATSAEPLLEPGDRLTREEFERRYHRMPRLKKAELIEGIVYMPSPVRARKHAGPHGRMAGWLSTYASETPAVDYFDNGTVRLDHDNEPQPDLVLVKTENGQTRISDDDYIEGSPELAIEIVASSQAYDLHQKKGAYRRNGVREYLAWITTEKRVFWWELYEGEYREILPGSDGFLKSRVFPGLWLDVQALLRGDMKSVLAAVRVGCKSQEHAAFVK
jgi:Uma2 family endonuclease